MNQQSLKAALLLAGALAATGARAEDDDRRWQFGGFGTVGAVFADTDQARFRSSPRQSRGAARTPDLGVDSRLGLQGSGQLNETFSAVGQLLASRRDGDERLQVEWLFAQASATHWLDLRAGRMVLPVFLASDTRNVGYSAHWARAPSEVYGIYAPTAFDGAQAVLRGEWAATHFTLQMSAGNAHSRLFYLGANGGIDIHALRSINLVAERGDWTARLGRTTSNTTLTGLPGNGALPFIDRFSGVGIARDDGRLLLQAEYVRRHTSDQRPDSSNYYGTAGYRLGDWMPFTTYSHRDSAGVAQPNNQPTATVAAGLRWDAMRNVAIKAQLESTQNNSLNFANATPAFAAASDRVKVVTLLVDFVF